jgi:hypothetical protein
MRKLEEPEERKSKMAADQTSWRHTETRLSNSTQKLNFIELKFDFY